MIRRATRWSVRKFCPRLFFALIKASSDPSKTWIAGELGVALDFNHANLFKIKFEIRKSKVRRCVVLAFRAGHHETQLVELLEVLRRAWIKHSR